MPNHNIVTTGSAEYIPLSNVRLSNSDLITIYLHIRLRKRLLL